MRDGVLSPYIWLVAFFFCPPAALLGAVVVVLTQGIGVGVIAGIAGVTAGFVLAGVMGLISGAIETLPLPWTEFDISDPDKRVGRGLMTRRKHDVRDTIELVLLVPFLLVAMFGAPIAALVVAIVLGWLLGS